MAKKIPVILDTDIGGDIDDTWALAMMLKSPELDVKMVASCTGHTVYRAEICAKILEIAGRTDVPVAVGIKDPKGELQGQADFVKDYDLAKYPGIVHDDGVEAMVKLIMDSPEPISLVSIGPVPNIAKALEIEPRIAERTRFVGMHGCVRKWWEGDTSIPEYNVKVDIPASKKVFTAPWSDITITPLDTCGFVVLDGEHYQTVRACDDPVTSAVIENYDMWRGGKPDNGRSSILFDTVAVYLAFADDLLVMEEMGIRIDDEGGTIPDDSAQKMNVAVEWKDMNAFKDFLVKRLVEQA